MKNLKIFLILLFTFFLNNITFSQIYPSKDNFPGMDIQLLVGKNLKVKELDLPLQKYGYFNFYLDSKLTKIYAESKDKGSSRYKSLVGKIFKVIKCESSFDIKYKLEIESIDVGVIFFEYNPRNSSEFPFEVIGGINFPEGYYCKDIIESVDKITNRITYYTPSSISTICDPIRFIKIKDNNDISMYITITANILNINKKGVILLLENGSKIDKPNIELDVKINRDGYGYDYFTYVVLNDEDIKLLIQYRITDFRLYTYDNHIENGRKYLEYLKCILNR